MFVQWVGMGFKNMTLLWCRYLLVLNLLNVLLLCDIVIFDVSHWIAILSIAILSVSLSSSSVTKFNGTSNEDLEINFFE